MGTLRQLGNNRRLLALLTLLMALATSYTNAHVHSFEQAGLPGAHLQLEDCALCHAGAVFTLESGTPYEYSRATKTHFAMVVTSSRLLGYIYIPESRPPPLFS